MSDYCAGCRYSPEGETGEGACPFNPRIDRAYATWDRLGEDRQRAHLDSAEAALAALEPARAGWAQVSPPIELLS